MRLVAGAGPARGMKDTSIGIAASIAHAREVDRLGNHPDGSSTAPRMACQVVSASDAARGTDPVAALMAHALTWLMQFAPVSLALFYTVDQRLLKFRSGVVLVRARGNLERGLEDGLKRYRERYHALDPFAPRRFSADRTIVVDMSEVSDPLDRSPYACEFLAGLGVCGQTTLYLRAHGRIVAGVDLLRARTDLPVSRAHLAFLRTSHPFLEHAYVNALGLPAPTDPGGSAARAQLTRRELQIAEQVAAGATNAEVARALVISEATVKSHLVRVFDKLSVRSRTQLAVLFNANRAPEPRPLAPVPTADDG